MNNILSTCPFCGSKDIMIKERKTVIIECNDCGALIIRMTLEDAKCAWNRRKVDEKKGINEFLGESIDFWCELKSIADVTDATTHIKEIIRTRKALNVHRNYVLEVFNIIARKEGKS